MNFDVIYKSELDRAFESERRQYLTGDLKLPQVLEYIKDSNVEIGMSRYKEYGVEEPHYHNEVSEYHFILSGETKYVDVSSNREYCFGAGDFYIIRPNTVYIQKSVVGTELMFIKVPGKNDKVKVMSDDRIKAWLSEWENEWEGL